MKPLQNVLVVELATAAAVPTAGRIMGQLGATVIKVEGLTGDPFRVQGRASKVPYSNEENPFFDLTSAFKKYSSINVKTPEGKEAFFKLLEKADIFISNYRPQALVGLGLDYDTLSKKFPKLIMGTANGYGRKGPDCNVGGYDATAFVTRGGYLDALRQKDGVPMNSVSGLGDLETAVCLTTGLLTAYIARLQTGKGDYVTASLYSTAIWNLGFGYVNTRYGNTYPRYRETFALPFMNTYKASDTWLHLAVLVYDRDFNKVMEVIGRQDLIDDPRYCKMAAINANKSAGEIISIVSEAIATKTADEWVKLFKEADLICDKAYSMTDIMNDPQALENNFFMPRNYANGNVGVDVNIPFQLESLEGMEYEGIKALGHDDAEIMKDLGYSEAEIEKLRENGSLIKN